MGADVKLKAVVFVAYGCAASTRSASWDGGARTWGLGCLGCEPEMCSCGSVSWARRAERGVWQVRLHVTVPGKAGKLGRVLACSADSLSSRPSPAVH